MFVPVEVRRRDPRVADFLDLRVPLGFHLGQQEAARARRKSRLSGPHANSPSSFRRLVTVSRSATGVPSLKFKCTPTPSAGAERAASTASVNATPLATSEALVTIP